jgi:hypothetical protein
MSHILDSIFGEHFQIAWLFASGAENTTSLKNGTPKWIPKTPIFDYIFIPIFVAIFEQFFLS